MNTKEAIEHLLSVLDSPEAQQEYMKHKRSLDLLAHYIDVEAQEAGMRQRRIAHEIRTIN